MKKLNVQVKPAKSMIPVTIRMTAESKSMLQQVSRAYNLSQGAIFGQLIMVYGPGLLDDAEQQRKEMAGDES